MYIRNRMTADPYTISKDASITDAMELMHDKNLRRVPVTDGDKAVGIITKSDIQSVSPTKATTLSIYEVNYFLSKTLVSEVMSKDLITISPDDLLEEAAVLMRENRISSLVVTDDEDKVVGIITESDIFDSFIDLLGINKPGTRISIDTEDKVGILADIAVIFKNHNANITNVVNFNMGGSRAELILRTSSIDTKKLEEEIREKGYRIISISENIEV